MKSMDAHNKIKHYVERTLKIKISQVMLVTSSDSFWPSDAACHWCGKNLGSLRAEHSCHGEEIGVIRAMTEPEYTGCKGNLAKAPVEFYICADRFTCSSRHEDPDSLEIKKLKQFVKGINWQS